ncbi:ATP-dependent RNA helicase DHX33 [Episyrphus balteatus]|uniref:ATP-dependent RNA helicase DHX33 n=1 Tax=Episyrphus balteatus TaxID=286459 RepID=UPI0024850290|nr:ATP-dependent RNA helicase DHX33 [Episyrphus balteatus]
MDSKYALMGKSPFKLNGGNASSANSHNTFAVKRKIPQINGGGNNNASNNVGLENRGETKIKKQKTNNDKQSTTTTTNGGNASPSVGGKTHQHHQINQQKISIEKQQRSLPVYGCRLKIIQEVWNSDTIVLMGETGSGKTTQIPQLLLRAGFGNKAMIAITQPRRVAAITVAKRVAQELNTKLGETVGFTVRFEDCTSSSTKIKFVTDGSLLREALSDRLLKNYSVIMLDEAHERTINTDVLFGIVKEAQKQRKLRCMLPLKVLVTSATMDIDHFAKYFGVKGMYLEGKTFPVKVMHTKETQSDYLHAILVTLFEIHRSAPPNHDVLVFLTGQEEIEAMAQQIRMIAKNNTLNAPNIRVFPLYSQLPQNKQLECFIPSPPNARKVILATNIAETSITIPGIRFVIDCGFVKRRIYNPETNLDILKVVRISQAQCWQRCGRAGRDAEGTCYRTYTKEELEAFEKMPKPEILRSNISATVLQLLALGIDCKTFDFLDKPAPDAIDKAYKQLLLLGAIKINDAKSELTTLGKQMSQFPLDPKFSKLLLTAPAFGCLEEMLSLVAILSGENIFVSSIEKREQAALAHAKFESKLGDHLMLLNVYKAFEKTDKIKLWCHDNFLNTRNLLYARDVRNQLLEISQRLSLEVTSCGNDMDQVRKCILAGLFDNIAELQRDNFYLTVSGRQRAKIHPSSILHGKYRPAYIIFTEIVLTERNFLRQVMEIEAEWIEEVVPNYPHLSRIRNPLK